MLSYKKRSFSGIVCLLFEPPRFTVFSLLLLPSGFEKYTFWMVIFGFADQFDLVVRFKDDVKDNQIHAIQSFIKKD